MNKKLTLRLEEKLIKRAKKYARKRGTSVSQIVANYFETIKEESPPKKSVDQNNLPPITRSLAGILKETDISEEDYHAHLEEKHLK